MVINSLDTEELVYWFMSYDYEDQTFDTQNPIKG